MRIMSLFTLVGSSLLAIASSAMAVNSDPVANTDTNSASALGISKIALQSEFNSQACPDAFYNVKLPNNGKLCQIFAADLPASMIFFVPQAPNEVITFYQQDSAQFSAIKQVKDRFILQSPDKNTTLIISTDRQGTQVDILVKSSDL